MVLTLSTINQIEANTNSGCVVCLLEGNKQTIIYQLDFLYSRNNNNYKGFFDVYEPRLSYLEKRMEY